MLFKHEVVQDVKKSILIVICIYLSSIQAIRHSNKVEYDGKSTIVPINPDKITDLYQHWTDQMFSSLLAAIASNKVKNSSEHVRDGLEQCSKNSKSVILHAKCVSALLNNRFDTDEFKIRLANKKRYKNDGAKNRHPNKEEYPAFTQKFDQPASNFHPHKILSEIAKDQEKMLKRQKPTRFQSRRQPEIRMHPPKRLLSIHSSESQDKIKTSRRFRKLSNYKKQMKKKESILSMTQFRSTSRVNKVVRKRMKREVIQKSHYVLKSRYNDMTALGAVAKLLGKTLMATKNKTSEIPWQMAVERICARAKIQKEARRKQKEAEKEQLEHYAFRGLRREGIDVEDFMEENPKKLKAILHMKRRNDAAKDPQQRLISLLRDGVKLGYSLTGQNTSNFDDKNLKAFSPRIMSVVPEQDDDDLLDLLSPSLFSLHDKGKGIERLTSLPNMVKGFSRDDQQEWLNFIIEAAGVNEQVERLEKEATSKPKVIEEAKIVGLNHSKHDDLHKQLVCKDYEKDMRDKNGRPLYFTKENVTAMLGTFEERKVSLWERLISTYSKEQLKEMNTTGFTVLNKEQLYILYGPESPFNNSEALHRLIRMNSSQIQQGIVDDVHRVASMRSFQIRQKDIVLSPIVFSPLVAAYPIMNQFIVLSPVVFSPVILTPAVLGPIVLSPWLFIPVILSPRVLSPLVLNPLIFSPIVLSPLVLHPLILSPGVFNPIVLSPLVLSPFILSPQVFTPVILSPLVLNPLILNPMVGSPLVLSPFVLSPVILSPQALFGVILSPYALSPLVESKLILSTIFLSPSWLS